MDTYRDALMRLAVDSLIDEADILERYIYDLLSDLIATSDKKDKAIEASSEIVNNLNKLDDIISELVARLDSNCSKTEVEHVGYLEEGKNKLADFKFSDSIVYTKLADSVTEKFEDRASSKLNGDSDFNKLIKNFVGSKMK